MLVTGGAGFIGSNLVRSLLASKGAVRVLDNLSTGSAENLQGLNEAVELVEGDIRDGDTVRRAVDGCELVFHLAALPSVARSISDPAGCNEVNVTGTLNLLRASIDAGVRRFVLASSSSVYGDTTTLPKHEELPTSPRSPYAASKLAAESYCRSFAPAFGLETVALRFFNVFGPRQNPDSEYAAVVPRFVTRAISNLPPVVFGDGYQSRDFTFVENAVQACVLAGEANARASGEAINVGCGERYSLRDMIDVLGELIGRSLSATFDAPRLGDVRDSQADISKARDLLGYNPVVGFKEGLARTIEWFGGSTYNEESAVSAATASP